MEPPGLRDDERIDDLQVRQLKIIQSPHTFSFSMDAVLLARFCTVPAKGRILDLCTGSGVIPLLLTTRTKARIIGVDIQPELCDMASRSVAMNGLQDQIDIVHGDLKEYPGTPGPGSFDLVTVNPPYMPVPAGETNPNPAVAAARHELLCNLEDVVAACARTVKSGGKVAIIHRPSRLADLVVLMRNFRIEPKRIRMVHPGIKKEANMVLIEGIKDGGKEIRMLPPLIVYDDEGQYTPEVHEIYYGSH